MISRKISELSDAELLELANQYDLSEILDDQDLKKTLSRIGHLLKPIIQEETIEIELDEIETDDETKS
jgi:uncharacterized protein YfbU (UPF0304 family)